MAKQVDQYSTIETFRQVFNEVSSDMGDTSGLRTESQETLVDAVNSIEDKAFFFQEYRFVATAGQTTFSGNDVANQIMRTAAKRGTAVHELAENYLNNEELSNQDVLPLAMFTILKPELDNINNIVLQEGALYSDKWGVAGRVDCIAEYDGKLSIIDFKTSSKLKEESWIKGYFMQCSAYAVMYEERTGIPVSQIVIMIAVDSEHPQVFIKKRNDYIKDFISYREAYDAVLID